MKYFEPDEQLKYQKIARNARYVFVLLAHGFICLPLDLIESTIIAKMNKILHFSLSLGSQLSQNKETHDPVTYQHVSYPFPIDNPATANNGETGHQQVVNTIYSRP
jgi:hypothetical protein